MFTLADAIRRTDTADGGILLDIRHGKMFCLNVVGARIIRLLENGFAEGQIAAEISREYSLQIDMARADVSEFIATLHKHQLLQMRGSREIT